MFNIFFKKIPMLKAGLIVVGLLLALGVVFGVIAFPKETLVSVPFMGIFFGAVYSESNYLSDLVLDEEDTQASREVVTVATGQNLKIGTVLGKATIGALSETHAGNTGNGVMTLDAVTPALANCLVGIYKAVCILAVPDGGTFRIYDPKGNVLGDVVVGGTFQNQIKFVIADGAVDFIEGDTFLITVAAGTGKVEILDPAGLDGTQTAYGVLTQDVDATAADVKAAAIVKEALLKDAGLVWPVGISAGDKATALAQFAAKFITTRVAA